MGVPGVSFSTSEVEELVSKVANAGTAVVDAKAGAGSATLSMAAAGAHFVMSVVKALSGQTGVVECAYIEVDGMETKFFALPVELGKSGIEKVHPVPELSAYETETLKKLIPTLQGNIDKGINFV